MPHHPLPHVVAALMLSAGACGAAGAPVATFNDGRRQTTTAPGEDFYYVGGQQVDLVRQPALSVVGFASDSRAEVESAIRAMAPAATLGDVIPNGGRPVRLVAWPTPAAGDQFAIALRSRPGVVFVTPAYRDRASRGLLLATDEVVVRVKPTTSPEELASIVAPLGLRVHARMPMTTDQFVLRLSDSATGAVRAARALYQTGRVDWAEPNFVRQMER